MKLNIASPAMRGVYAKGKSAAAAGLPRKCPYEPLQYMEKQRSTWLAGWDAEHARGLAEKAKAVVPG